MQTGQEGGELLENQKIIAMVIALFAALLVIIAGRSCTASIENANRKNKTTSSATLSENNNTSSEITNAPVNDTVAGDESSDEQSPSPQIEYVTDILGRVIGTKPAEPTAPQPVTEIEYATDTLGRVVGTKYVEVTTEAPTMIEYVTDILGRVTATEYVTIPQGEAPQQTTSQTTSKKSVLEQYEEDHPSKTQPADEEQPGSETPGTLHITIG